MSESLPIVFGVAWCLLCLLFHQARLIPPTSAPITNAAVSFARLDLKICRCAASWLRKTTCVTTMASATASATCAQLSPMNTAPTDDAGQGQQQQRWPAPRSRRTGARADHPAWTCLSSAE